MIRGTAAVCSWSGGKDSCLALHRAIAAGAAPAGLITMLTEGGRRTRSHGLRVEVVEAQAAALGLPLLTRSASWAGYEDAFGSALRSARALGAEAAIFGDIDLDEHRDWCVRVCRDAGLEAVHPLWQGTHLELLDELLGLGYEAVVVAAQDEVAPRSLLGRRLDGALVAELVALGIDPAGEGGELHTVVVDGPLFGERIELELGDAVLRDGVWFLDLAI